LRRAREGEREKKGIGASHRVNGGERGEKTSKKITLDGEKGKQGARPKSSTEVQKRGRHATSPRGGKKRAPSLGKCIGKKASDPKEKTTIFTERRKEAFAFWEGIVKKKVS